MEIISVFKILQINTSQLSHSISTNAELSPTSVSDDLLNAVCVNRDRPLWEIQTDRSLGDHSRRVRESVKSSLNLSLAAMTVNDTHLVALVGGDTGPINRWYP